MKYVRVAGGFVLMLLGGFVTLEAIGSILSGQEGVSGGFTDQALAILGFGSMMAIGIVVMHKNWR